MADQEGFVKLDRNLLRWQWITTPNTSHLFVVLLLKANYKDMEFKGKTIHRGQLVTSIQSLADSSGLTYNQVRIALGHLKATGSVTARIFPKYQVITIVNYDLYQDVTGSDAVKPQASHRQTTGKPQQEKERKEGKKERNKRSLRSPAPSGSKSDRMPGRSDGTVDDIPMEYRKDYKTYAEYYDWRNQ